MRVLVTGGAGFVGSHVVDLLLRQGHEVTVVDDLTTGLAENVDAMARLLVLDIRAPLDSLMADVRPETVIHLAAQVSVPDSLDDPWRDLSVNIGGTVNVFMAAARAGVRKVVSVSSAAVYGAPEQLPLREASRLSPLTPYGLSKLTGERYVEMLGRLLSVDYTIIRPANIFGPRQTTVGEGAVVPAFIASLLAGHDPVIQGDGEQTRDFIYVTDMADAIVRAIDRAGGETLNISSNRATSINELWRLLARMTGWARQPVHGEARRGDIRDSVLDNTRARCSLDWQPRVKLADGLRETVAWYRAAKANGRA
ncbi:MAG: NAD-dependent epimerase/dehydratase family protein [Chloroflexota bacterium]